MVKGLPGPHRATTSPLSFPFSFEYLACVQPPALFKKKSERGGRAAVHGLRNYVLALILCVMHSNTKAAVDRQIKGSTLLKRNNILEVLSRLLK